MKTTNKSTNEAIIEDLDSIIDILMKKYNSTSFESVISVKERFLPLAIQVQKNALIYDALLKVGSFDDDKTEPSPLEKIAIEITEIASKSKEV